MNIIQEVEQILDDSRYNYNEYSGCFDIVARRHNILFLKILYNIDSFQQSQATNLKILSHSLDAPSIVIGKRTIRETLKNNIVYERFNIPACTPATLENILNDQMPFIYRSRGGLFTEIDPEKLKRKRRSSGFSQKKLAEKVGVTKKSIYEHEKRPMKASFETVRQIETVIGDVKKIVRIESSFERIVTEPQTEFEKKVSAYLEKLGFHTDFVCQVPFNILAKRENFLVFSNADEKEQRIKKKVPHLLKISEVTKKPVLVVTKSTANFDVPVINDKELRMIGSVQELKKVLK